MGKYGIDDYKSFQCRAEDYQTINGNISEKCLGFISLGKNVTGEKEKAHWFTVMSAPRKNFTTSFKLE